ncbi:acid protease [Gyrodon lividus]|nr:acid protease [Gyrodon lividus]
MGFKFTLATVIAALPLFVSVAPQPAKQGGKAISLFERSSLVNADNSVNVEALNLHVASTTAKILRGFDNFERHTGNLHPSAVKGHRKRESGGTPLGYCASIWYGLISVGIPPMPYDVMFDTGSRHVSVIRCMYLTELDHSDLILPGPNCDQSCDGHDFYDPKESETSIDLHDTFEITFTAGNRAFGQLYIDTVSVAGLVATEQIIGAASYYSSALQSYKFPADGLIGMAFQSVSAYDASPVFQTLISDGEIDEPVFAFSFAAPGPELYLGGTNPAMYSGDFTYVGITTPGFWQVDIDGIVGNGETMWTSVSATIDTGTVLIYGHPEEVGILYDAIGGTDASETLGKGYYTFPCNDIPSVSFIIGGTSFPISAGTLSLGSIVGGSDECIGSIIGRDFGESTWLIGTAFLRNVYTAFDMGAMRVGFAAPAPAPAPSPSVAAW